MKEDNNKKKKIFEKLMMGAIIGGAIGSVVGASVKGKKDENIKKEVLGDLKETTKNSKKMLKKITGFFRKKNKSLNVKTRKIPNEMEEYQNK